MTSESSPAAVNAKPRTRIYLVRHGEVHNPHKVLYGREPGYRLSKRGQEQAELVGEFFAEPRRDIVAIVASPLQRAQETARPVATEYHLPIQTDSRLTEAGNKFEGTTIGAHPWQLLKPKNLKLLRNPFRPSWGEPFQEQAARMAAVVAELREEYAGHEVVVVSHQSPIWMLRRHLEGKALWGDPRRRQCSVCSVTILDYDAGADTPVISYEEPVAHLSQTLSAEGWSAK